MTQEFKPRPEPKTGANVRFDVKPRDLAYIGLIVARFLRFLSDRGIAVTENHAKNLQIDLGVCHRNGCELDLNALLQMDLTPFVEDCVNIGKNLDRNTGKLMNGYRPRCAKGFVLFN